MIRTDVICSIFSIVPNKIDRQMLCVYLPKRLSNALSIRL